MKKKFYFSIYPKKTIVLVNSNSEEQRYIEFNENITIGYLKLYVRDFIKTNDFDLYYCGFLVKNEKLKLSQLLLQNKNQKEIIFYIQERNKNSDGLAKKNYQLMEDKNKDLKFQINNTSEKYSETTTTVNLQTKDGSTLVNGKSTIEENLQTNLNTNSTIQVKENTINGCGSGRGLITCYAEKQNLIHTSINSSKNGTRKNSMSINRQISFSNLSEKEENIGKNNDSPRKGKNNKKSKNKITKSLSLSILTPINKIQINGFGTLKQKSLVTSKTPNGVIFDDYFNIKSSVNPIYKVNISKGYHKDNIPFMNDIHLKKHEKIILNNFIDLNKIYIWINIFSYLDLTDLCNFSAVNKRKGAYAFTFLLNYINLKNTSINKKLDFLKYNYSLLNKYVRFKNNKNIKIFYENKCPLNLSDISKNKNSLVMLRVLFQFFGFTSMNDEESIVKVCTQKNFSNKLEKYLNEKLNFDLENVMSAYKILVKNKITEFNESELFKNNKFLNKICTLVNDLLGYSGISQKINFSANKNLSRKSDIIKEYYELSKLRKGYLCVIKKIIDIIVNKYNN